VIPAAAALLLAAAPVRAQGSGEPLWNDARALALVERAIARRTAQLADTGLADYRALAHGYLTFLAQVGEGFPDPPTVVRADELAVEVYWRAPNQSKQRVIGRRDTLLLPTDIVYHRDHLAIVQNNFPAVIRLGDGDEVRDVPHPLSGPGRAVYDYAVGDSLTIASGDRTWDVVMVRVRPRNERAAAAVGAVYLDRETASVVRMTFGFTRAALLDKQLEDVAIVLDNGLVDARFWLPRRQEIEIRRAGEWLDFPARGIIRGRWEICCVQANVGVPAALFAGPEIVFAPAEEQRAYAFPGRVLDSLPAESRAAGSAETRRIHEEARRLVRAEALERTRRASLGATRVSDLVRVNRVEGVAVGAGTVLRLGHGLTLGGGARFGGADHALKHRASLGWQDARGTAISLLAFDDFRAAADEPEASGVRNSITTQELGEDFSDDYRVKGLAVRLSWGAPEGTRWSVSAERIREDSLAVHARAPRGSFRPAFPAEALTATRVVLGASATRQRAPAGALLRFDVAAFAADARVDEGPRAGRRHSYGRVGIVLDAERPAGAGRLVLHTTAAATAGASPPRQALAWFGGPVTGPGYEVHSLRSMAGVTQRVEWRIRVASVGVPLGRFGTVATPIGLAPFVQGVWTDAAGGGSQPRSGWHPSAGVGVLSVFDLVRLDVARGLGDGGRWAWNVDLGRFLWRIL
jgi:hypothetical protein